MNLRSFKRKMDSDRVRKAQELGKKVENSLNASRIPKRLRSNNIQVRAFRKVVARQRSASRG